MRTALLAWRMLWGAPLRSGLILASIMATLAFVLAVEIGADEFLVQFHDAEGRWLGADLILMAREPLEELAATPRILETIAEIGGHALHLKVGAEPRGEARLGRDAANLLGLKLGQRFSVGKAQVQFRAELIEEPDRFIGLPSTLPRILISHADWELSGLGAHATPPLYRYLFRQPAPGLKEELLRLYPGALVLGKEDRYDGAAALIAQAIAFVRIASAWILTLGLAAVFFLLRLGAEEDSLDAARLKLLGAGRSFTRRLAAARAAWWIAIALAPSIAIAYAIVESGRLRMAYFLPFGSLHPRASPNAALALAASILLLLLVALRSHRTIHDSRPGPLLRKELESPVRAYLWTLRAAVFLAVVTGGLAIAYFEFTPQLAKATLPDEDGVLVIGAGPPADVELETVWVRVLSGPNLRTMGLATCTPYAEGARLADTFAARLHLKPGDFISIALGRNTERLQITALEPAHGVIQFLRQLEIPCRLTRGAPRYRLAWHKGSVSQIKSQLPPESAMLDAQAWKDRVSDLASRAVWLPQLAALLACGLALLTAGATWRSLLHARRGEIALWRIMGASRRQVARRLLQEFLASLLLLLTVGSVVAWLAASLLLRYLTGSESGPSLLWIPLSVLSWAALVLLLGRGILHRILRQRPLAVLRAQ